MRKAAPAPRSAKTTTLPVAAIVIPKKQPKFTPPKSSGVGNPLNFFIHHVNHAPPQSNHLINLKTTSAQVWKNIEAAAPTPSANPGYHFYHKSLPDPLTVPTNKQVGDGQALPLFQGKINSPTNIPLEPPSRGELSLPPLSAVPRRMTGEGRLGGVGERGARGIFAVRLRQPISWQKISGWYDDQARSAENHLAAAGAGLANQTKKIIRSLDVREKALPRLTIAILVLFIISTVPTSAATYYQNLKNGQQTIVEHGTNGFTELAHSGKQLIGGDLASAANSTELAIDNFNQALGVLSKHGLLASAAGLIPGVNNQVESGGKLLLAGQAIALGNSILLSGLASLTEAPTTAPTARLASLVGFIETALPNYEHGLNNLAGVDPKILPPAYQEAFINFRTAFGAAVHDLRNLTELGKTLPTMFGGAGLRRYLLIFQNPHELRPTGGFMGSFAILEIKDGAIVKLEVPPGGTYDLQGQLDTYVEPPAPLLLTNKRWEFQDANWFPDFPTSAEKILWFYRHSRGLTADGVIAMNASVLERLLTIIGPVTDDKRQLTLSSASALTTIQNIVEQGPEKAAHRPKQILSDLTPQLLKSLQSLPPEQWLSVLFNLEEALDQKEIQAYVTDTAQQSNLQSFGWDGRVLPTSPGQDYLFAVNANIQGQKSDAKITQTISHQAVVQADGSVIDTVVITREHQGAVGAKMYGAPNSSFLRLYVPLGSELLSAAGFSWPDEKHFRAPDPWSTKDTLLASIEKPIATDPVSGTRVTAEFNKTVFGNWVMTNPGEVSRVQFAYRLPFKVFSPTSPSADQTANLSSKSLSVLSSLLPSAQTSQYQLVAQRQSGSNSNFLSQIIFPTGWTSAWSSGENLTLADNGAAISPLPLTHDSIWSLVMEKYN